MKGLMQCSACRGPCKGRDTAVKQQVHSCHRLVREFELCSLEVDRLQTRERPCRHTADGRPPCRYVEHLEERTNGSSLHRLNATKTRGRSAVATDMKRTQGSKWGTNSGMPPDGSS